MLRTVRERRLRVVQDVVELVKSSNPPLPLDQDALLVVNALQRADLFERDEHHTMDELYLQRLLYNAAAANAWYADDIPVVKSTRHHDGEECFGGGWFIVTAQLPTGQISNHYRMRDWDLFAVPAVDLAPEWDGHDALEAARRLKAFLLEQTR